MECTPIENDIYIDGKPIGLPNIMRKLNFVEDLLKKQNSCALDIKNYIGVKYTRDFTVIYAINNELFIGHCFDHKEVKTKIQFSDLNEWIKHFNTI